MQFKIITSLFYSFSFIQESCSFNYVSPGLISYKEINFGKILHSKQIENKLTVERKSKRLTSTLTCRILEVSRKKVMNIAPPPVSREQWSAYWGMNSMEKLQKV